MSCRQCHLGDDFFFTEPLAQRTYADFVARSAIPRRPDGHFRTLRNSQMLVDLADSGEPPPLFHFDGEFASLEDLVGETFIGRNFGWTFGERKVAIEHIAKVIREDAGFSPRHIVDRSGNGIPYRTALLGVSDDIPESLRIPIRYRIDVINAASDDILLALSKLVHAYLNSLRFGTKDTLRIAESPYDAFLGKNRLPTQPALGQSSDQYARGLAELISNMSPVWVTRGNFILHDQAYRFGPREFRGLRLFLARAPNNKSNSAVGNCVACHPPPRFTDSGFHNTGISQLEYDALFGNGAFMKIRIPTIAQRTENPNYFLPATWMHPEAQNRFRTVPQEGLPGFADLGLWNIFGNPDFPRPQAAIWSQLCPQAGGKDAACNEEDVLRRAVAAFKTPSLRDLGHSDPYFHSGSARTIEQVLKFYRQVSKMAKTGRLRNGAMEISRIHLNDADAMDLAAFLRSLNEDYH
jgi:cytochrome c peroxidase